MLRTRSVNVVPAETTPVGSHLDQRPLSERLAEQSTARPKRVVYLMRGLPSCGKSHMARRLAARGGAICETDEYFHSQVGSDPRRYDFRSDLVAAARTWNFERFRMAIAIGIPLIVVDRGNGLNRESRSYAEWAARAGYATELCEPDSPWWLEIRELLARPRENARELGEWAERLATLNRSTHRVPAAVILRWMEAWRSDLTVTDILRYGDECLERSPAPS